MLSVVIYKDVDTVNYRNYKDIPGDVEIVAVSGETKSAAFNKGLALCKGDYVIFLENEDDLNIECVMAMVKDSEMSTPDVITFDYQLQYPDGYKECNRANTYHAHGSQFLTMLIQDMYCTLLSNKIFRVNTLRQYALAFDESFSIFHDKLFLIELYCQQNITTSYYNQVGVCHQTDGEHCNYDKKQYVLDKQYFQENIKFIEWLQRRFGSAYKQILDKMAFDFKMYYMDYQYVSFRRFNTILPTPLYMLWSPNFSFMLKVKYTIIYILNKLHVGL